MKKEVQVKVERRGKKVRVQNSLGMDMEIQTTKADYIISSLVGLTMAEFFQHFDSIHSEFQMTLYVEGLNNK